MFDKLPFKIKQLFNASVNDVKNTADRLTGYSRYPYYDVMMEIFDMVLQLKKRGKTYNEIINMMTPDYKRYEIIYNGGEDPGPEQEEEPPQEEPPKQKQKKNKSKKEPPANPYTFIKYSFEEDSKTVKKDEWDNFNINNMPAEDDDTEYGYILKQGDEYISFWIGKKALTLYKKIINNPGNLTQAQLKKLKNLYNRAFNNEEPEAVEPFILCVARYNYNLFGEEHKRKKEEEEEEKTRKRQEDEEKERKEAYKKRKKTKEELMKIFEEKYYDKLPDEYSETIIKLIDDRKIKTEDDIAEAIVQFYQYQNYKEPIVEEPYEPDDTKYLTNEPHKKNEPLRIGYEYPRAEHIQREQPEHKRHKHMNSGIIMDAESTMNKKGGIRTITTSMNVKKGLSEKIKNALELSIHRQAVKSLGGY